jgi:hypothetical protein
MPPIERQPPPEAPGTPWEHRAELGWFEAWKQTLVLALFEPVKLFAQARLDRGRDHLWFAVLTGGAFLFVNQLLERILLAGQRERARQMIEELRRSGPSLPSWFQALVTRSTEPESIGTTIAVAALAPVMVFLGTYVNAAVTHASAMITGQAKRGFAATFTAVAYGTAPMVLLIIPGCGGLIALVWMIVLIAVGMRVTHGISTGGAAAAVLAPYLFLCCGTCLLTVAAVAIFGRSMVGAP